MAYLRLGAKAHMALSNQSNKFMNPIELTIRTEQSYKINDEKRKQQTPIEQLNEQCLNELKKELKLIFGNSSHAVIVPERAIKEMVKLMPYVFVELNFNFIHSDIVVVIFLFSRTKEAMIKDVNEITEERYKRHELHRLLAITQRFGNELDEIKRKEAMARKALSTASSVSKRKSMTSDEEDTNFSVNPDGYIKINKQRHRTNGHFNRFTKHKKRPASFFARRNAIAKRKRGGF